MTSSVNNVEKKGNNFLIKKSYFHDVIKSFRGNFCQDSSTMTFLIAPGYFLYSSIFCDIEIHLKFLVPFVISLGKVPYINIKNTNQYY